MILKVLPKSKTWCFHASSTYVYVNGPGPQLPVKVCSLVQAASLTMLYKFFGVMIKWQGRERTVNKKETKN